MKVLKSIKYAIFSVTVAFPVHVLAMWGGKEGPPGFAGHDQGWSGFGWGGPGWGDGWMDVILDILPFI